MNYFLVYPDAENFSSTTSEASPRKRFLYSSGRPWVDIFGFENGESVSIFCAKDRKLVLVGNFFEHYVDLDAWLLQARSADEIYKICSSSPGSFFAICFISGETAISGDLTGMRRVFYSSPKNGTIASNRADILADRIGARVDTGRLAIKLLDNLPYPFSGFPVWKEILPVPEGSQVILARNTGEPQVKRWWHPPYPDVSMAEAAPSVSKNLREATSVLSQEGMLGCDISGGLDSTPLFLVASETSSNTVGFSMRNNDPGDDDFLYIEELLRYRGPDTHVVVSSDEIPGFYDNISRQCYPSDDPSISLLSSSRLFYSLTLLKKLGVQVHMNGQGGDQVFSGVPSYLHDMARKAPVRSLRFAKDYLSYYGSRAGALTYSIIDNRSYSSWIQAAITRISRGKKPTGDHYFNWSFVPRLPAWSTSLAKEATIETLREIARSVEPVSEARGVHADISALRSVAHQTRILEQSVEGAGVKSSSPYLDNLVASSCLSVSPEERCDPHHFKALAKLAFRQDLPPAYQDRKSKTNGGVQVAKNYKKNQEQLRNHFLDSPIFHLDLIQEKTFKDILNFTYIDDLYLGDFQTFLSLDVWARGFKEFS